MNEIYVTLFCVSIFLSLSIFFHNKISRSKSIYSILLLIIVYLGFTYLILFLVCDYFEKLLKSKNIQIYYSHNDMVVLFEIYIACFFILIFNIVFALFRRKKF